ncbi:P74/PIF0 [Chrysodeixis includens nucleopolyhedrovirus]|uniref:PIF-0 n=1 Tax=Chrysodeixis includens nucleopolyhedrovirus TaxID=1207438 RepID=A0A1C8ZXB8_9ABAC|nr:P74/PIF0 [Chrysodeixis includens nucleopolyhedrovirus]AOL56596.1 P74/PIF0 [Chrysodeixis includens nucleopolyhedrovirus]AOL56737.1 P74/PIF0 [Chrysodeixis includens nucleopolyhedrovirus]QGW49150.1 PIF-0 [Chrysodeixis includens nucleopolyhedrovirus]QGW49290.1 PIF-0 [Chrysodeixis includens nucleopolyhedrovirus]
MSTLTAIDIDNAFKYSTHMHRLNYIHKWRSKFPNIFINYEIRAATNDDFYVPLALADRAIAVKLEFSKEGCESISCYPYNEYGPIDFKTPTGYTQTSDVAIQYAQPACYHLDRAAATREGAENEVQAPELRYTDGGKCILVDTLTKMYMNSPYLRTDEHLIQGVDDVPGFNVVPDPDPLFPERFKGEFNEAYCRRFGRSLVNGGCSLQWWESLIGFVLGDTIYITFKMLVNNVFSELRDFNYSRPSPELPPKPIVDSERLLNEWRNRIDSRSNLLDEIKFAEFKTHSDLTISRTRKLVYIAEKGFHHETVPFRELEFRKASTANLRTNNADEESLDDIITQFLEDNSLLLGLATSYGFDVIFDKLKAMLKRINTTLIPAMKRLLLDTSKRVTVKMLGETYKAFVAHTFNRIAIKTLSTVAKAMTRITIKAASVVGILLIIFTISDLILAFWDPFGYSNMFPRDFPDDLSRSFLAAYFESISDGNLDMIEWLPEYFEDLIEEDDVAMIENLKSTFEYVTSLEVNSDGQLLEFDRGEIIEDFDEVSLIGNALASSALYTRLEFLQYTARHNKILYGTDDGIVLNNGGNNVILPALFIFGAVIITFIHSADRIQNNIMISLFIVFLLIACYLIIQNSLLYYLNLRNFTSKTQGKWYDNLYN